MHLLLIRHATAVSADEHAGNDADRELTQRGIKRFKPVARRLAKLVDKPRAIFASPLVRARQTAEILATVWEGIHVDILPALTSGDWAAIWNTIRSFDDDDTILLVGHEDWLSNLTARLLGSTTGPAFGYRKGGVALLDVARQQRERATLVWFLPPRVLRALD